MNVPTLRPALRPCRRAAGGFTIIELMVAAGITVVIAALMLVVVNQVMGTWNRTRGRLAGDDAARLVLDQVQQDLTNLVMRRDGRVWLAVTVQDDDGPSGQWVDGAKAKPVGASDPAAARAELPADELGRIAGTRFGKAGLWLRLVTQAKNGADTSPLLPVAVGYQIIRRRPAGAMSSVAAHYLLYRSEADPNSTFTAGYDLKDDSTLTKQLMQPADADILADNVIDFGVWFYTRNTDGSLQRIYPVASEPMSAGFPDSSGQSPVAADIMVRILTPQGAQLLSAYENGRGNGDWWTIAEANSKVYTRRVLLPVQPL